MKHLMYLRLEREDGGVIESRPLFGELLDDGSFVCEPSIDETIGLIKQLARRHALREERRRKKQEDQSNE